MKNSLSPLPMDTKKHFMGRSHDGLHRGGGGYTNCPSAPSPDRSSAYSLFPEVVGRSCSCSAKTGALAVRVASEAFDAALAERPLVPATRRKKDCAQHARRRHGGRGCGTGGGGRGQGAWRAPVVAVVAVRGQVLRVQGRGVAGAVAFAPRIRSIRMCAWGSRAAAERLSRRTAIAA